MTSLELRGVIGSIRLQHLKGEKSKEETLTSLQNIDWNQIEELEVCPISSLQLVVNNYINQLNQQ
jgi:hypothetical protein